MSFYKSALMLAFVMTLSPLPAMSDDLENAWHVIRPVIHANDAQKAAAMRSATVVVLATIERAELFEKARDVEKPAGIGGPDIPVIPLRLARISIKPLVSLVGEGTPPTEFYSWVWASGKHGGPRLFHPTPDSVHVLFLTEDSGYLHTVGDYPAYDLEVSSRLVQNFIDTWRAGYFQGADLLERIAAVRLKAEFEGTNENETGGDVVHIWDLKPTSQVRSSWRSN
jgi:hypothetical protein